MRYIVLVLAGIIMLLQLLACIGKRVRMRTLTKCLLLPMIAACYLCWTPPAAWNPLVLAAMLFGWLGDVLLLNRSRQVMFVLGASSFCVGHLFYMAALFFGYLGGASRPLLLLSPVFLLLTAGILFFLRRDLKREKTLRIPMIAYFLVLSALGLLCAAVLYTQPSAASALLLAGALLFLCSDTILVTLVFRVSREAGCGNFWVMLTYIAAQSLLAAGFCL